MKVSVVVPVYRVPEALLRACVASLLRQALADMEFLLVVDGAEDPGRALVEEAARRDSRVRVWVNEVRRGVSAARNRGLELAQGDWIGFVDADDRVEPQMYARLVHLAEAQDCDLAGCGFVREGADGATRLDGPAAGVWDMAVDVDAARAVEGAKTSCCSKLFRRDLAGELRFDEALAVHEDMVFLTEALNRAARVGFTDEPLYRVCYRPDSAHRRAVTLERFLNKYQALGRLARLAVARSQGTTWMRRLWAWRLLSWSVAARRPHDELPSGDRAAALVAIRDFFLRDLAPFHETYPRWLRRLVARRLADEQRFFGPPGWFYTLVWHGIRNGMAPFEGRSRWDLVREAWRRRFPAPQP